jgi:hypothetical protein
LGAGRGVCQPFGTNVIAVCRLPHAKAITGQIILYLENFNTATKCRQTRGPGWSGGCYAVAVSR